MSSKLNLERFTRQQQTISGDFEPMCLSRLKPFLAGKEGEIRYTVTGSEVADPSGRRIRRLKCIILGWFLVADPESLEPQQYELSIKSSLVLVDEESELPPLEEELPDEDYVALGQEIELQDLIEEEILLDLPLWAIAVEKQTEGKKAAGAKAKRVAGVDVMDIDVANAPALAEKKISPFSKLAVLKNGAASSKQK
jgi:Large ribosomal RNA subunit accumulation protein YceD